LTSVFLEMVDELHAIAARLLCIAFGREGIS
jgi:hypothetical protein